MALRRAGAEPCAERRHRDGFEVPEHGNERERCADDGRDCEQEGRAAARPAAPQRPANERRRPDRTADRADHATDSLVPLAEEEPDRAGDDNGDDEPGECATQRAGGGDADRGAEADEDPDRVPVPHAREVTHAPSSGRTVVVNGDPRPQLVFFTSARSGPARRMESLVAHLARKERDRLRVIQIDVDGAPAVAKKLRVEDVPTLVLVVERKAVARLTGRVSAPKIEEMLDRHLAAVPA